MFKSSRPGSRSSVLIRVSSNGLSTVLIALTSAVVTSFKLPKPPMMLPDSPYVHAEVADGGAQAVDDVVGGVGVEKRWLVDFGEVGGGRCSIHVRHVRALRHCGIDLEADAASLPMVVADSNT